MLRTDRLVDLAHCAAPEHDPELVVAELLIGPAAFRGALLPRLGIVDLGERLLAIADHAQGILEIGERACVRRTRPAR